MFYLVKVYLTYFTGLMKLFWGELCFTFTRFTVITIHEFSDIHVCHIQNGCFHILAPLASH